MAIKQYLELEDGQRMPRIGFGTWQGIRFDPDHGRINQRVCNLVNVNHTPRASESTLSCRSRTLFLTVSSPHRAGVKGLYLKPIYWK
ncbi:hypothetical protein EVAR_28402_1 [Eumeta japonica]|uniref:Uncharacterized protein n=1 Tax=Eumeta variegata TaxID=151549 RepID=A0A4C1XDC3_EUMVA|nr:hypothetical protein EVAR_28402_1 [Eumeta japonica]